MGKKKIIRNNFSITKPGQKKLTKREAIDLTINEIEESYTKRLNTEVNIKVADFIGDFCLALAWSLRNNHNYGAKRIERTIRELFEVVSDAKMKEAGQILFDMSEIKEQLLVETGLDIEPVIVEEVNKHLTRVKEFKEIYESLCKEDNEDKLLMQFKQAENNILEALSDVNDNLKEAQETLSVARRDFAFANSNIKAWENKKKQLENKLKKIRREWGENNV